MIHADSRCAVLSETGKGSYILLLCLMEPTILTIGRLGVFKFPAGWYTYVGSAFGSGGLSGRLKHHCSLVAKPHWHIDYLRQVAPIREVWYSVSETVYEHTWAAVLRSMPGAAVPAPRFGASDCHCETHLIYLPASPVRDDFSKQAGDAVQRWQVDV